MGPAEVFRLCLAGFTLSEFPGVISTAFSKIPGVSGQGTNFPISLGSHTGDELPTFPFCFPAQHLHFK